MPNEDDNEDDGEEPTIALHPLCKHEGCGSHERNEEGGNEESMHRPDVEGTYSGANQTFTIAAGAYLPIEDNPDQSPRCNTCIARARIQDQENHPTTTPDEIIL